MTALWPFVPIVAGTVAGMWLIGRPWDFTAPEPPPPPQDILTKRRAQRHGETA